MVSRTVIQHESSNSLVETVAHSPLGARLRSECRPTMASAPPRPSGAIPLTDWFAISCRRPSPVTANSPSCQVATSIVGFVTDYLPSPGCRGLSEWLNKAMRSLGASHCGSANVHAQSMILPQSRTAFNDGCREQPFAPTNRSWRNGDFATVAGLLNPA